MPKPFCPLIPFAQLASDELLEHWAVSLMRIALVHDELLPNGAFYDRVGKIVVPAALSDNIISIFTLSNVRIVDGKHSHLHDLAMWDEIQSTWVSQEGAQTLCRTLGFSIATWPRWLKPSLSSIFVEKLPGEKTARRVLKVFRPVFFPKYGIKMYPLRGPPRRIVPPSSVIEDGDGPVSGESSDGDSPALSVHGNGDEKDQDLVGQALAGTGRIVDRDLRGTLERLGQALKNSATDASDELSCSATPIADGYAEELELPPSVNGPLIPREILPAIIEELERALLPTTEEHVRALARLIVRSYCSDAFDNTEGYVDDLVQQLSEFPADIVESAMRGGGLTLLPLPLAPEICEIATGLRERRRYQLEHARWCLEDYKRGAKQAERRLRRAGQDRPKSDRAPAAPESVGDSTRNLSLQQEAERRGLTIEEIDVGGAPWFAVSVGKRGEQILPAAKERPGAKASPQHAAPDTNAPTLGGSPRERLEAPGPDEIATADDLDQHEGERLAPAAAGQRNRKESLPRRRARWAEEIEPLKRQHGTYLEAAKLMAPAEGVSAATILRESRKARSSPNREI